VWQIKDRSDSPHTNSQSHSDQSWIQGGFFLKWFPLSQGDTNSSVTLVCFGPSHSLVNRFLRLAAHDGWRDAVDDPYGLFVIVLNELFLNTSGILWRLSDVFRSFEMVRDNTQRTCSVVIRMKLLTPVRHLSKDFSRHRTADLGSRSTGFIKSRS
jgi:hypothetical protein